MARRGVEIDRTLVETAALLHDVDKMLPADDPLRELGHGAAGAEFLRRKGHPELSDAVAGHPVMVIAAAASYDAWAAAVGVTGQVVGYADKRAIQDLVSLEARFDRWHRRYPDSPELDEAQRRAERLEEVVCAFAGVRPSEVRREAWVAEVLDVPA